jgi:hypothetical protein
LSAVGAGRQYNNLKAMLSRLLLLCALFFQLATAAPPTPASHFAHPIGVDKELLDWNKVVTYFQALEKTSDKVRFKELGKSADGRPFIAATISSAATLKNLDHYLDIQKRLSDPRRTTPAEAQKLITEGKTVVLITCSIHATEVASTHTAVEFAYRLITEDNPRFRAILDNVILLLVPSQNPDGVDIVTQWYRKTLGTPWEGTQPPELYHKYTGHDNNRDWYMFSQPETQNTGRLQNLWHPQIVYDVHQMGPNTARIFVPPWMDPVDPNIDAILAELCNMIGMGMAVDISAAGKKGVAVNAMYDFWSPARHYMAYHGGMRILTESASARLASPITITPDQITDNALGYNPRVRSWNYLEPWMAGEWHLRDIIDYQEVAWDSLLYQAAIRRADLLRYFYEINQRAVARTTPYAFVIPAAQRDPGAAKKMLETLAFGEVEIERSSDNFSAGGRQFPTGSYVIRMHQPYSSYAKTLLERQDYPDLRLYPGGPPKRPYDVTAQTLPMLMGVEVATIDQKFEAPVKAATQFTFELNHPVPAGALAASDVYSWREVNKIWKSGAPVYRDPNTGDFFRTAGSGRKAIAPPRIGLFKSFMPSMDEGWTRWMLEDFGFAFSSPGNADIQAGHLRQRFDAIVIADQQRRAIAEGHAAGSMPPEYCGGLGEKGAAAFKEFVEQGGTLIFFNHSSEYATQDLGVKARNVLQGVQNRDFYSPGSLLNVTLDTKSPLAYGMPQEITLWSEQSPAWEAADGQVVARYPATGVLASGWLLGEKFLNGKAALLDVPMGSGHVILFGMRPQYRAQSYQNFKLFFNAMVR